MKKKYQIKININDKYINANGQITGDGITWNLNDDMHLFTGNHWEVTPEDLKHLGIPTLTEETDFQDKKVYRYPKLDLPRQKVDLLKDKFNCKVIRDVNKSDINIVSMKFFDSLICREWKSSINFVENYNIFKHLKDLDLLSESALVVLRDFMTEADRNSMVLFEYNKDWNGSATTDKISSIIDKYIDLNNVRKHSHDFVLKPKDFKNFDSLMNSTSIHILDTSVCNLIDVDLAVLENKKFSEVEQMVTSSDIENRSLALEMLANSNIEKSFDVVSGLYYWHYDWLKATTNWNTVNVKAFRKRMKAYEGNHGTQGIYPFNNYLNLLAKDRKLTKFAVDTTREKLHSTFLNSSVGPEAEVFKVDLDSLYINEELTNKIIIDE